MPTPGALMRLVQPQEGANALDADITPPSPVPNVEGILSLEQNDGVTPSCNTFYLLSDIDPVLRDVSFFDRDVKACASTLTSAGWVIVSFVDGRNKSDPSVLAKGQLPMHVPAPGTAVVFNGGTPRADKEQDYHNWYHEEHGPMLSKVPGWQSGRRYKLEKVYGEAEVAAFYGCNFYDEANGLGGPVWKAAVDTDWTLRVRSQGAKPNVRRVWKVKSTNL